MRIRAVFRRSFSNHLGRGWHRLLFLVLLLATSIFLWQPKEVLADAADAGCQAVACVSSSPQLADIDSTQSELLDAVLGNLVGVDLDLDVIDTNGLLNAEVDAAELLETLAELLGLATVDGALSADVTLDQLLDALSLTLQADGDLSTAAIVDELSTLVESLPGTIQLNDLLEIETPDGSISNIDISVLDLVSGLLQLYSYDNVVGANAPITISGGDLGLGSILVEATLQAYVTEPPVIVCGSDGTTFHSAAIRLQLGLDLLDVALDTEDLEADLIGEIEAILSLLGVGVEVDASLAHLDLYAEVARGDGTITFVDALQQAVTVQAQPGAVDLYLGQIDEATFFNRSVPVATENVDFATVASLAISVTVPLLPDVNVSADVGAKAWAQGDDGTAETLSFTGPYPQTLSTSTDATLVTNLLDTLLSSLELQIDTSLGTLLDPLIDSIILPGLEELLGSDATGLIGTLLDPVLAEVVDPLVESLGIGLGQMHVTVHNVGQICPDLSLSKSHTGSFVRGESGVYELNVTNGGSLATSDPIQLIDTLPAGMGYQSHSGDGWILSNVNGQVLTFQHSEPLTVGAMSTLFVTVTVDRSTADSVTNTATVSVVGDQNGDNNAASDPTTVTGISTTGDEDGDCVPNGVEDRNGNGIFTDDDTDGDGTPDYLDPDDDGDSLHTCTVEDVNGNGDPTDDDTDGDGTPDYLDPDDDDDTVPTENEDPNGNNDPTDDDTDNDGTPDYLDPDDDGDTVPTENEDPNGNGDPTDDDTDDDGTPDYLDPDDDGDTVPTEDEDPNGNNDPTDDDTDDDGTPDYLDPDDDGDTVPTEDEDPNGNDDPTDDDTDDDGTPDYLDPDDDGDTVPTEDEDPNGNDDPTDDDTDDDGTPDYLDPEDNRDTKQNDSRITYLPLVRNH